MPVNGAVDEATQERVDLLTQWINSYFAAVDDNPRGKDVGANELGDIYRTLERLHAQGRSPYLPTSQSDLIKKLYSMRRTQVAGAIATIQLAVESGLVCLGLMINGCAVGRGSDSLATQYLQIQSSTHVSHSAGAAK